MRGLEAAVEAAVACRESDDEGLGLRSGVIGGDVDRGVEVLGPSSHGLGRLA